MDILRLRWRVFCKTIRESLADFGGAGKFECAGLRVNRVDTNDLVLDVRDEQEFSLRVRRRPEWSSSDNAEDVTVVPETASFRVNGVRGDRMVIEVRDIGEARIWGVAEGQVALPGFFRSGLCSRVQLSTLARFID